MAKEITSGYVHIGNADVVTMEQVITDYELTEIDVNDDPEWLLQLINDSVLPLFKKILNTLK